MTSSMTSLVCAPTSPYVYNLRSPDGSVGGQRLNQVERINTDEENSEPEVIADFADLVPEQTNALGIGRDEQGRGRYLYFTTHNIGSRHGASVPPDDQDVRYVYRYDLLTDNLNRERIPNEIWRADSNHIVRHGAVDYSTGIYYFATSQSGYDAFSLIAYDPSNGDVWLAGDIHTPGAVGDSGDMAFDSLGNLYFIVGAGSTAHLYTAPGGSLPTSSDDGAIDLTLTRTGYSAGVTGSNGVGVAYGHYGYLFVTYTNGHMHQVDPSTGQSMGRVNVLGPAQPGSDATPQIRLIRQTPRLRSRRNLLRLSRQSQRLRNRRNRRSRLQPIQHQRSRPNLHLRNRLTRRSPRLRNRRIQLRLSRQSQLRPNQPTPHLRNRRDRLTPQNPRSRRDRLTQHRQRRQIPALQSRCLQTLRCLPLKAQGPPATDRTFHKPAPQVAGTVPWV